MQATGDAKYRWGGGAVSPGLAAAHLAGTMTVGASLHSADGQTLGLCWDADDAGTWAMLQHAAACLTPTGARPLLEPSPRRGGHLWLTFADLVNVADARATAEAHAPQLASIKEAWPHPTQGLRLPGGRYIGAGIDIWPMLIAPHGERAAGRQAIALMRANTTPTAWVQASPASLPPVASSTPHVKPSPPSLVIQCGSGARSLPAALSDPRWLTQYGPQARTLWFAVTDAEAAAWYNQSTTCRDLLPPQASGYGLATWRGERTASVSYVGDGWVDRGAGGGDAGDALELYCRLSGVARPEALRGIVRGIVRIARAELESAARQSCNLPVWVEAITTPAGWTQYDALRRA